MVNDSHTGGDDLNPGEYVLQTLFSEFTVLAEKKIDRLMKESLVSCRAITVLFGTLGNIYGGALAKIVKGYYIRQLFSQKNPRLLMSGSVLKPPLVVFKTEMEVLKINLDCHIGHYFQWQ